MASESMLQVRLKLESRASTGFIINRDWQRILDTRVSKSTHPPPPNALQIPINQEWWE